MLARNFLFDGLFCLAPPKTLQREDRTPVLLVRLDAIGDFVLWLDAAAALRTLYPSDRYRLVLLGNDLWTDLALQQPFFDEVIPVDMKRLPAELSYRGALWRCLRSTRWGVAVNPTRSRHFPYDDATMRVCGAKERIGFEGDRSNQRGWELAISDRWYTRLLPASPEPLMELERNAEFVRGLGLKDFRAGVPALTVMAKAPLDPGAAYCVVVPGASLPIKQWPLDKFAELVQRIRSRYDLRIAVCGAATERELGQRLMQMVPDAAGTVHDLTGSTSLAEFAAIVKGASLVVANDSSAVHIAAAVGTRSICFVGGGHYGRFVPYRVDSDADGRLPVTVARRMECYHCNWNCIYPCHDGAAPCLEGIRVADAWHEVRELLESGR